MKYTLEQSVSAATNHWHPADTCCPCLLFICAASCAGDGFLVDTTTISKYDLTDPTGFFNEVLNRPYRTRILLAPHLYGPSVSGVPAAEAAEIAAKLNSSWGIFSTDGYCNGNECIRFPVVAGEPGAYLRFNITKPTVFGELVIQSLVTTLDSDSAQLSQ